MKKITPHLWFDKEAKEAAEFYCSLLPNSKIKSTQTLHDTPSGDAGVVSFEFNGYPFMAISAGPLFKFNPSVSFTIALKDKAAIDALWSKLIEGGQALMPLEAYPFSEKYGWVEDKYGLSWQLVHDAGYPYRDTITPSLTFVRDVYGKAEEAMNFYASIFPESKVGSLAKYPAGMEPDVEGKILHGSVILAGQEFFAMESAHPGHQFKFNEAVSFMVNCEDQKEIDYYWEKLSAVPEAEQCGWLKDKYGLSWQIVPTAMNKMMAEGTPDEIRRVTQAFLKMKKIDIAGLERARRGRN
jgi:predicted 3-demethylubiquinone-9 3-methyltransferase (glyoxalase superfamily)